MTGTLDERARVTVSPSVYARTFGEEVVLLEFGKGEYFGLDVVGTDIWRRLEGGAALGAVADHIATRYDVGREEALRDIVDLVSQLRDHDLVSTM